MFARVLVCAAAAVVLQLQTPAPATAPTGLVVGQVVDATTGQPIPEAEVTIRSNTTIAAASQVPVIATRVLADGNGRYFFAPLPAGGYQIRASKPGYLDGSLGARRPPTAANRAPGVVPFELGDAQRVGDATIRLWKTASITGTVVDDGGDAVAGVGVWLLNRSIVSGRPRFTFVAQAVTDDRGTYRASHLAPGEYIAVVPSTQITVPPAALDMWQQSGGGFTSSIARELNTVSRVVAVTGSNQSQQVGAHMMLTPGTQPQAPPPGESDLPLVFRTAFFPAAVALADAEIVSLKPGENRAAANIQLRAERAVTVSGIVTGPEGALPWTALRLTPAAYGDTFPDRDFDAATGLTNEKGEFTLLGVTPGQYVLKIVSSQAGGIVVPGMPGAAPTAGAPPTVIWATYPLTVGESDVANVSIIARAGLRVTGRIDIASAAVSAAPPTLGVQETVAFVPAALNASALSVVTSSDRTFSINLPGARYYTRFEEPPGWWITSVTINGRDVGDGGFDITEDATMVVRYSNDPSRVSGTVRNLQGSADANATVLAFPRDRQRWLNYGPAPARMGSQRVAASGAYAIANLPAGDYFVIAVADEDTTDWTSPAMLERLSRVATAVTIRPGEKRSLDLRTAETRR